MLARRPLPGAPRATPAALAISLALLIACCAGVWQLTRPQLDRFIAPGAAEIQVQPYGFGEQRITYQAPGAPYAWYFWVTRNLAAEGWSAPIDNRIGIRNTPEVHWRISQLWFVYLKEEATLQGDPNLARITLYREIIIPWRRYLP